MQSIEPLDKKNGVEIEFQYEFSWAFVETCRKYRLRFNKDKKVWVLKFNNATLPLDSKRIVRDYKDLFAFYNKASVSFFSIVYDSLVKIKNHKHPIFTEKLDLDSYTELYQHQKAGIQFLQDKNGLGIIADEQGLGKTKMVAIWCLLQNFKKVLIVTPFIARSIWKNELLTIGVPDDYITVSEKTLDKDHVYFILNYEKLKKFETELIKLKFDCCIFDEAHKMNNRQSLRFKTAKKITKKIPRVICVTGTPLSNKPAEIFPLLHLIKSPLGSNFVDFAERYCNRHLVSHGYGQHYDTNGASNLDELGLKLKDYMIRRLKENCLDIPDKQHHVFKINLPDDKRVIYDKLEEDLLHEISIHGKTKQNTPVVIAKFNLLRQFCAEQKLEHTEAFIKDALQSNEKLLIFGFFNETLEALNRKYEKHSVLITGKIRKQSERDMLQKEFQTNPDKRVFIGNIKAAGFALTLTAGNICVFNDLTWNPTDHSQAEDRIHRISTTKTPRIYYLVFKNTIEDYVYNIITRKQKIIDVLMNASEEHFNNETVIQKLIDKYKTN